MWLAEVRAEVRAKAKRHNQFLFSKESFLLDNLRHLIDQANRRVVILWALELAEETVLQLTEKTRKIFDLMKQLLQQEHGLPVKSKCPL